MLRIFVFSAVVCAALALVAPSVRADTTFDLELPSNGFSPTGSGTILLATDPGNGTFAFTNFHPSIAFTYNGLDFTENDIFQPGNAQFILSDFNGRRRFQFENASHLVSFDKDLGGGNFFEVSFRNDTYTTSGEIGDVAYSALAASSTDVPEPGSVAAFGAVLLSGGVLLRKRRAAVGVCQGSKREKR